MGHTYSTPCRDEHELRVLAAWFYGVDDLGFLARSAFREGIIDSKGAIWILEKGWVYGIDDLGFLARSAFREGFFGLFSTCKASSMLHGYAWLCRAVRSLFRIVKRITQKQSSRKR